MYKVRVQEFNHLQLPVEILRHRIKNNTLYSWFPVVTSLQKYCNKLWKDTAMRFSQNILAVPG